ncbi:hypothetical protein SSCG_04733 [Streptomyces clavuligerus]|nr:hypothetical protein SSCG_04733 [Streptomyces clavuligerus]
MSTAPATSRTASSERRFASGPASCPCAISPRSRVGCIPGRACPHGRDAMRKVIRSNVPTALRPPVRRALC